jgi:hypothetical protein
MNAVPQLQLERDARIHAGDVLRFSRKRGRTLKTYYIRATSAGHLAQYSPRSTLWVSFTGRRVRCYDHAVTIGPETEYSVAVGQLTIVSRGPLTLRRAGLAGLTHVRPAHTAS